MLQAWYVSRTYCQSFLLTAKPVLYVLQNVFRAPEDLKQQNAFLTSELKDLFSNASPLPSSPAAEEDFDGNRKPIEGDCPICFMEFEEDEELVWCRAACGNNIHKACLNQWIDRNSTCPFCRAQWQSAATPVRTQKMKMAKVDLDGADWGTGGYRNVRAQLNYDDDG